VRAQDPAYVPPDESFDVYLDGQALYCHARADCPVLASYSLELGFAVACVSLAGARRLGYFACWTCCEPTPA